VIRLYDTGKWQPIYEPLSGHSLTVTRIAFSPDDRLILSVSRDRSWRLYELRENLGKPLFLCSELALFLSTLEGYVPVASNKSHARIIWDCSWAAEGDIFATASRDKSVRSSTLLLLFCIAFTLESRSKSGNVMILKAVANGQPSQPSKPQLHLPQ
jgi:elongator complex protein 2